MFKAFSSGLNKLIGADDSDRHSLQTGGADEVHEGVSPAEKSALVQQ